MALNIADNVKTAGSVAVQNVKKFIIPLFFGVLIIAIICGFIPAAKKFLMAY